MCSAALDPTGAGTVVTPHPLGTVAPRRASLVRPSSSCVASLAVGPAWPDAHDRNRSTDSELTER